jgi:hypothetical protein
MSEQATAKGPRRVWLTGGQIGWRVGQLGLVGALLVGTLFFNAQGGRLLLHTPAGQEMLIGGGVLLAIGLGLLLLASVGLNCWAPAGNSRLRLRRWLLSGLLEAVYLFFFYLPVIHILLVGPAALQIAETLARP